MALAMVSSQSLFNQVNDSITSGIYLYESFIIESQSLFNQVNDSIVDKSIVPAIIKVPRLNPFLIRSMIPLEVFALSILSVVLSRLNPFLIRSMIPLDNYRYLTGTG